MMAAHRGQQPSDHVNSECASFSDVLSEADDMKRHGETAIIDLCLC